MYNPDKQGRNPDGTFAGGGFGPVSPAMASWKNQILNLKKKYNVPLTPPTTPGMSSYMWDKEETKRGRGRAAKFVKSIMKQSFSPERDSEERIMDKTGGTFSGLQARGRNEVHIGTIQATKYGSGTELLKKLTSEADKRRVRLSLTAAGFSHPRARTAGYQKALETWYKQHGFQAVGPAYPRGTQMVRLPKLLPKKKG